MMSCNFLKALGQEPLISHEVSSPPACLRLESYKRGPGRVILQVIYEGRDKLARDWGKGKVAGEREDRII